MRSGHCCLKSLLPYWKMLNIGQWCFLPRLTLVGYPVKAVRPHLGAIAAKMEEMWKASQLSVSERNVLCDSMLAAAASGDPELRSQVHVLKGSALAIPSMRSQRSSTRPPIAALKSIAQPLCSAWLRVSALPNILRPPSA